METVIIYSSKYGHSEAYANILHNHTGYPVYTLKEGIRTVSKYDRIILVSSVYSSSLDGYDKLLKKRKMGSTCIVIAVGISDPSKQYEKILRTENELLPSDTLFYVRGGFDYSALKFTDKKIVDFIVKHPGERDQLNQRHGDKGIIRYYKKSKNFVKEENLKEVYKVI